MEFGVVGIDVNGRACMSLTPPTSEDDGDLRRGPWTVEEDLVLMNYINCHGEGRWNSLARCAGLKRTGKSCRLRWLNYLRPDVRRGNITPEEQLLILELHSRWGNRWSKIAQHLPGRTDNEIKNYWRTRVQKHARQLKCDVNSKQFKDAMRYLWMPRLMERIRAAKSGGAGLYQNPADAAAASGSSGFGQQVVMNPILNGESSCGPVSSFDSSIGSLGTQFSSPVTVTASEDKGGEAMQSECWRACNWGEGLPSPSASGYPNNGLPDFDWWQSGDLNENLWSMEDNWLIQQQLQQDL